MERKRIKPNQVEITLASGRTIDMRDIRQSYTYQGVIEGDLVYIHHEILENARARFGYSKPPVVIIPEGHEYLSETDPDKKYEHTLRHLHPRDRKLPRVCCSSMFRSVPLGNDQWSDWSMLGVIWFQDTFIPHFNEDALEKIKVIDWETNCVDGGI